MPAAACGDSRSRAPPALCLEFHAYSWPFYDYRRGRVSTIRSYEFSTTAMTCFLKESSSCKDCSGLEFKRNTAGLACATPDCQTRQMANMWYVFKSTIPEQLRPHVMLLGSLILPIPSVILPPADFYTHYSTFPKVVYFSLSSSLSAFGTNFYIAMSILWHASYMDGKEVQRCRRLVVLGRAGRKRVLPVLPDFVAPVLTVLRNPISWARPWFGNVCPFRPWKLP